jgi:hypothetical protein
MRKLFLIKLVLILFVYLSFGQEEWAPIGAKWYYSFTDVGSPGLTIMTSINDTVIQNKTCKKFEIQNIFHSMNSEGKFFIDTSTSYEYCYFENNSIFHYDKADYFYKLYDFSVAPDDTVLVRDTSYAGNFSYERFEYVVDSISHITIDAKEHLTIHTSPTEVADWSFSSFIESYAIIEKIGSTCSFFGISAIIAISSDNSFLRCYMDQEIFYRSELWDDTLSCDFFNYNVAVTQQSKSSIKIFPNPFSNSVQVTQESNKYNHVKIIDLTGRVYHEERILGSNTIINLSSLPKGIYIISLINPKHNYRQKILKY